MMYWLCFSVSLSFFCWGKTSFPQSWCVGYQYGKGHVALVTFLTERKLGGDPDLACLVAAYVFVLGHFTSAIQDH